MSEELIGQRFGKLTVIRLVNFNKHHQRRILCLCDCGNEKIVLANKIKTGQTSSCGCLRIENSKNQLAKACDKNPKIKGKSEPRIATAKIVYRKYSDGNLSFDDFLKFSQQNCFYCGVEPSNTTNYYITKTTKYSKERQISGYFTYNGLDRINSKFPHNLDNLVTSCIDCNKAKLDRTQEEFFIWIARVYAIHPYR